jgi:alkyl sulfatase BDS1-like metallo-beta-lactamase superfamily hydrolase
MPDANCEDTDCRVVIGMSFYVSDNSVARPSTVRRKVIRSLAALTLLWLLFSRSADGQREEARATKLHDAIYQAGGNGNTYLVITRDGNVIIDTSTPDQAPKHKKLLSAVNAGPVKYIILTHGHEDHRGGVGVWKEEQTQVIAQKSYAEFYAYQCRLAPFFARRMAAQFRGKIDTTVSAGLYDHPLDANILYDERYDFELGGIKFELHHTPGETYDHTSVWIPQFKAAFVGDNYSPQFPALYTLRGTKPRWALDYVDSLNQVLGWHPALLLPGHGEALTGNEQITKALSRFRDAIRYVHDQTVRGMNEGKDVFQLMQEIKLPPEVQVNEGYGTVAWSVRGIYDGYAGWFDGNPASMYPIRRSAVYGPLVQMAGGADAVARRASELVSHGDFVTALQLTDIALAADPHNAAALRIEMDALRALEQRSKNQMERNWLRYGIEEAGQRLGR